jgi:hypothetical protein
LFVYAKGLLGSRKFYSSHVLLGFFKIRILFSLHILKHKADSAARKGPSITGTTNSTRLEANPEITVIRKINRN